MDAPVFSAPWKQPPQELRSVMLRDVGSLLGQEGWQGMGWDGRDGDGSGGSSPALGWLRTSCHSLPEVPPASDSKGLCLSPSGAPEQLSVLGVPEGRFSLYLHQFLTPPAWEGQAGVIPEIPAMELEFSGT